MLYLLFHPGAEREERMPFSVSEANIDDALDYGRAERDMTFDEHRRYGLPHGSGTGCLPRCRTDQ